MALALQAGERLQLRVAACEKTPEVRQADRDPMNRRVAVGAPQKLSVCRSRLASQAGTPPKCWDVSAWSRRRRFGGVGATIPRWKSTAPPRADEPAIVPPACSLRVRAGAERGVEFAQVIDAKRSQLASGLDQQPGRDPPVARVRTCSENRARRPHAKASQIALQSAARGEPNRGSRTCGPPGSRSRAAAGLSASGK